MAKIGRLISCSGLLVMLLLGNGVTHSFAGEFKKSQGPPKSPTVLVQAPTPAQADRPNPSPEQELPPGGIAVEDLLLQKGVITMDEWIRIKAEQEYRSADQARRLDAIEDWKERTELLPILRDKVNFGLNALQFLYGHSNAQVPEGKSQDSFSIRRAELIFWGKISDTIPRWHTLFEFQSTNLTSNTPTNGTSTPSSTTNFREAYIDFRPIQSWAPNLNYFRMGIFRMPWGIFTETSGGLRDVISSPYLTSVGGGTGPSQNANGTGGNIEFVQERDYFVDVRGKIANRLEYAAGITQNNNYQANGLVNTNVRYRRFQFAKGLLQPDSSLWDGCIIHQFHNSPGRNQQCRHPNQWSR